MIENIKNKIKELEKENICILDLMIVNEIESQKENELTNQDYSKLYSTIRDCYLKTDSVSLYDLVNYCIRNIDKIDNMSTYDIIENSYICF